VSAHQPISRPAHDAPPCTKPLCPSAVLVIYGARCPHLTGANHLRKRGDHCALPPDVRVATVRGLALSDPARAARLAAHFGLPRDLLPGLTLDARSPPGAYSRQSGRPRPPATPRSQGGALRFWRSS